MTAVRWVCGRAPATPPVRRAPYGEKRVRRCNLSLRLQIELVYDPGCPNVDAARDVLTAACRSADVPTMWTEWNSEDSDCPPHASNLGSPTILVNGEDVAPGPHPWAQREPGAGPRCRVYRDGDAIVRAPPRTRVAMAIERALQPEVG